MLSAAGQWTIVHNVINVCTRDIDSHDDDSVITVRLS
jgi:hypothetical protein